MILSSHPDVDSDQVATEKFHFIFSGLNWGFLPLYSIMSLFSSEVYRVPSVKIHIVDESITSVHAFQSKLENEFQLSEISRKWISEEFLVFEVLADLTTLKKDELLFIRIPLGNFRVF